MAKTPAASGGMVPDVSKLGEVRGRLFFLLAAIVVFRIGSYIPVPGIDSNQLAALFDQQKGTILDMFNMFSGGALHRFSIFALGVMPYISASIIVQLLTSVVPSLKDLRKEGDSGRRTLTSSGETREATKLNWPIGQTYLQNDACLKVQSTSTAAPKYPTTSQAVHHGEPQRLNSS